MIYLERSKIDSNWIEVIGEEGTLQEIEVRFPLRKFPKKFDSAEQAVAWIREMERKLAKSRAYRLLAIRPYPSALLYSKLAEKGYSPSICREIVDELVLLGYIQDKEWIQQAIVQEIRKGYGPRYIEMKFKAKGIGSDAIRDQYPDLLQQKKIKELAAKFSSRMEKRKIMQTLARRGFDFDQIVKVVD